VNFVALDPRALGVAEPHLRAGFAGALHWIDPYAVNDPHALTLSYAALFERLGGCFVLGDAATLTRYGAGWRVFAADGSNVEATEAVVALGISSDRVTKRFGYGPAPAVRQARLPPALQTKGECGAHATGSLQWFSAGTDAAWHSPDDRRGIRASLGRADPRTASPRRAHSSRTLLPLDEVVEQTPWMGIRPCTPDMLPIIGPAPSQAHLWFAFGHAHHGFTLGPITGSTRGRCSARLR
jgi:D-amino-acid dehydrogenase